MKSMKINKIKINNNYILPCGKVGLYCLEFWGCLAEEFWPVRDIILAKGEARGQYWVEDRSNSKVKQPQNEDN